VSFPPNLQNVEKISFPAQFIALYREPKKIYIPPSANPPLLPRHRPAPFPMTWGMMRQRLHFRGKIALAILATVLPLGQLLAADTPFRLQIDRNPLPVISWPSATGMTYRVEYQNSLAAAWETLGTNLPGTGLTLSATDGNLGARRFYRVARTEIPPVGNPGPVISTNAIPPEAGVVYPENTILGTPYLGLQFTIPPKWKGGLRDQSATMIFASDLDPGLILGLIPLSGSPQLFQQSFNQDFYTSDFGGFQVSQPPALANNRLTAEWTGIGSEQGVSARLIATMHPSGGGVGFMGFFTEPNRAIMEQTLEKMAASTLVASRDIDTQWVQAIAGRAFQWVKSTSVGNGGTSGSLSRWSQKNAFFCAGTYEITTQSESSYSGTLSGGAVYGGGSSSTSTEAGDWTVIRTPAGPLMLMASSSGFQGAILQLGNGGNSFLFGDQEYSFLKPHLCP